MDEAVLDSCSPSASGALMRGRQGDERRDACWVTPGLARVGQHAWAVRLALVASCLLGCACSTTFGPADSGSDDAGFADADVACFTHGGSITVQLATSGQRTRFTYTGRSSIQPPAELEAVIDRVLSQMVEQGRDAGVILW